MTRVIDAARERIQRFADIHGLTFNDHGEVGFGRPCVGLIKGRGYVNYNPYTYVYHPGDINPDLVHTPEFEDRRLGPPDTVTDAYHKHDCLAVLVDGDDYDTAILQLADWVAHLERIGVEVAEYQTGAQGVIALVHGTTGYAIRSTDGQPWLQGQPMPESMRSTR